VTDEPTDDEPETQPDSAPEESSEGGLSGWRERHREKLAAEHEEEGGDAIEDAAEVKDEAWKILGESPGGTGRV
jgi:hypothetical protein